MTTAKISHRTITRTRTKDSSSLLSTEYKERKERCFRKQSSCILACLEKKKKKKASLHSRKQKKIIEKGQQEIREGTDKFSVRLKNEKCKTKTLIK